MQILIAAIGKRKFGPGVALYEHYIQRLPWPVRTREFESKTSLPPARRKSEEGSLLLAACEDADHVVALDERGREMTSPAFALHLQKQQDKGARRIAFVIGGPDGLDEAVFARADLTLAFGRVTWPHLLVRGLLAEQLYRAHSILARHPYHRE